MSERQKLLAIIAGVWATSITVVVIRNAANVRFNLESLHQIIKYLEQEQYDGAFSQIVNDLEEPPFHD